MNNTNHAVAFLDILSVGQYSERNFDSNKGQFIFGEALSDVACLEKTAISHGC